MPYESFSKPCFTDGDAKIERWTFHGTLGAAQCNVTTCLASRRSDPGQRGLRRFLSLARTVVVRHVTFCGFLSVPAFGPRDEIDAMRKARNLEQSLAETYANRNKSRSLAGLKDS